MKDHSHSQRSTSYYNNMLWCVPLRVHLVYIQKSREVDICSRLGRDHQTHDYKSLTVSFHLPCLRINQCIFNCWEPFEQVWNCGDSTATIFHIRRSFNCSINIKEISDIWIRKIALVLKWCSKLVIPNKQGSLFWPLTYKHVVILFY